ncbi:MAG: epoxyqueuosine reductase QueH [Clostridia bacterium]|nr:epoxyqueuosine reductase QueH [Clostridia bacterium]
MQKRNYQKELDKLIENLNGEVPKLMLHGCCAPCSSYCLEYLSRYFDITLLFYNPNISSEEEYFKREEEVKRLISELPANHPIKFLSVGYDTDEFEEIAKGLEDIPEGGARCFKCYELRMKKAAELAKEKEFDYFTTTLSISPLKNSQKINEIGQKLEGDFEVKHLPSDFKKKEGYKRSIELSHEYNLYRQNFCGCRFSKSEAQKREEAER